MLTTPGMRILASATRSHDVPFLFSNAQPLIKSRNYDPGTRTIKKHTNEDPSLEDTVEKRAAVLTKDILAEDEKQRAQDLVTFLMHCQMHIYTYSPIGCF